ncbi:MAG: ABC transporter ATP-binding protein [Caldilineaceae bacterium]
MKPKIIVADEPVSMIDASLQMRILDIFLNLKDNYGISFLYITPDLSTAYQISDDIYILYSGSVMEHGDIDRIIQEPQHPYTQLLVSSMHRARSRYPLGRAHDFVGGRRSGCRDTGRLQILPALPPCHGPLSNGATTPDYPVAEEQFAACYLYAPNGK